MLAPYNERTGTEPGHAEHPEPGEDPAARCADPQREAPRRLGGNMGTRAHDGEIRLDVALARFALDDRELHTAAAIVAEPAASCALPGAVKGNSVGRCGRIEKIVPTEVLVSILEEPSSGS